MREDDVRAVARRMSAEIEDRLASEPAPTAYTSAGALLDARGAAALLNVPATWVLAEARADRIPHVRLGRYVRFDAADLQAWWQSRRRGPWRQREPAAEPPRSSAQSATTGRRAA